MSGDQYFISINGLRTVSWHRIFLMIRSAYYFFCQCENFISMAAKREVLHSDFIKKNNRYKILVPLQDVSLSKTLLPPAIRAAKQNNGEIILLSIIEIPYQLPPSEAEQFKLEKEFELQYALQVIETAGCPGEIMVRIAHRFPYAIEQLAGSLHIDLIIMWTKNKRWFWHEEILKKLYNVKSEILAVNEKVEPHFDDVILVINKLRSIKFMLRHAFYLMGSEKRKIHIITDCNKKEVEKYLQRLRHTMHSFSKEPSINQFKTKMNIINSFKEMPDVALDNTCMLISAPFQKKSKKRKKLEANSSRLGIPVFLLKTGKSESPGVKRVTTQIKQWLGIRL